MVAILLIIFIACAVVYLFGKHAAEIKKLKETVANLATDRNNLQNRVDALEFQLTALQADSQRLSRELLSITAKAAAPAPAKTADEPSKEATAPDTSGTRYFANVINSGQGYFRAILDAPDYTVKFIARANPANPSASMLFEPVNLKTLQTNDGLDKAVTIVGDVPPVSAVAMVVEQPGIATLAGNRWIIERTCKVSFN
ncbi:MAG: TMF family protein [Muribaculaceae bacterium]|nr:TMF family protein [Muribaculaceae bacterium]